MATIPYELRTSKRARTMRISVQPDSRVVITVPPAYSPKILERFLAKHAQWIERAIKKTKGKRVIRLARKDIPMLKKRAAAQASARCAYFAQLYSVQYKKISIRAQKTRWGSCSKTGTLCFNYKIAALPLHIADYIIVHEICHIRDMNHSKKFWAQVARAVPRHPQIRKELRQTVIVFF